MCVSGKFGVVIGSGASETVRRSQVPLVPRLVPAAAWPPGPGLPGVAARCARGLRARRRTAQHLDGCLTNDAGAAGLRFASRGVRVSRGPPAFVLVGVSCAHHHDEPAPEHASPQGLARIKSMRHKGPGRPRRKAPDRSQPPKPPVNRGAVEGRRPRSAHAIFTFRTTGCFDRIRPGIGLHTAARRAPAAGAPSSSACSGRMRPFDRRGASSASSSWRISPNWSLR